MFFKIFSRTTGPDVIKHGGHPLQVERAKALFNEPKTL
jgi:hypothetical protein